MSYYREQLEAILKNIDVKADRVLDIGGGALPVKNRVRSWDVKKYLILDNELEKMKQKPDIKCDLNEYRWNDKFRNYFDIVFCLEVMEYIFDPLQALENIYNFLKPEGIAYISFPFIYPHHAPESHDYLRYTKWGVRKLLEKTGFKNYDIITRVQQGELKIENWFKSEGMHPAKGYSGHNEIGYLVIAQK